MGGKVKQTNPQQATMASAGADAAGRSSAALSDEMRTQAHDMYQRLYGGSGVLNQFLDPSKLNVDSPQGPYALMYKNALGGIAHEGDNTRGAILRDSANRGFGANSPAGFTGDQMLQSRLGESAQKGAAFTDYAGRSYDDALNNFWKATGMAAGQQGNSASGALQGSQNAGSIYGNIYGTAGQGHVIQNPAMGVLGAGIGAGGTVGAAAMCPAEGALITLMDGTKLPIESLEKGISLLGIDDEPAEILHKPIGTERDCVEVTTANGYRTVVSNDHTFALAKGGYEFALSCEGKTVLTQKGPSQVTVVMPVGPKRVLFMEVAGCRTYASDGIWSLM